MEDGPPEGSGSAHGSTNRPGSLSRIWRVAGSPATSTGRSASRPPKNMEDRTSPGHGYSSSRIHRILSLNFPQSLFRSHSLLSTLSLISLSLSRSHSLVSLSLCIRARRETKEEEDKKKKERNKKEEQEPVMRITE
jgi:hypothetical protein